MTPTSYFDSLIQTHHAYLLGCAWRLTRNEHDARDLVQDTCVHALEALRTMETSPDNLRGWLVVIMRNHWFNAVRHLKVRRTAHAELASRPETDSGLHDTRAVYSQFDRAWRKLPEQARCIAQQCLIEGDSQEDVSRRFGMTAGGVAASIHRTRAHLHESLFGSSHLEFQGKAGGELRV